MSASTSSLRLGLVGHPIAKSLSPLLHRAALARLGLAGDYSLFDVAAPEALEPLLVQLRGGALDGLNVTVPYKEHAFSCCDRVSPLAQRLGAVNTLARSAEGGLVGHNTDLPGLVAAIRDAFGAEATLHPGETALVCGAGGAAASAVLAAHVLGAAEVRVHNRTHERAEALCTRLGIGVAVGEARAAARGVSLVIQASIHGMGLEGQALARARDEAHAILAETATAARVIDLVYRPSPTAYTLAAASLGRAASDGLGMLVHQAALALELWIGARAEVDTDAVAMPAIVEAMWAALR